jgi:ribosomal protein L16/L10AE
VNFLARFLGRFEEEKKRGGGKTMGSTRFVTQDPRRVNKEKSRMGGGYGQVKETAAVEEVGTAKERGEGG